MKTIALFLATLSILATTILPTEALAYKKGSPYKPEIDQRFDQIESMTGDVTYSQTGTSYGASAIGASKVTQAMQYPITADGLHSHRIARATWDFAVDGGTVAAHATTVTLPAKALITRSWIYVVTQIVDAGSGTMAISCEDANNIKTATDLTGTAAGGFIEGASTGAISAAVGSINAACAITFTIATAAATAGKLTVFVEYVVGE
jgi:hypothetical protein